MMFNYVSSNVTVTAETTVINALAYFTYLRNPNQQPAVCAEVTV